LELNIILRWVYRLR